MGLLKHRGHVDCEHMIRFTPEKDLTFCIGPIELTYGSMQGRVDCDHWVRLTPKKKEKKKEKVGIHIIDDRAC